MEAFTRDAVARADRLARLECVAAAMEAIDSARRRDVRALLAAALALLLALYPGMSAAAMLM